MLTLFTSSVINLGLNETRELDFILRRNFLYNSKLKDRARELRSEQTPAEKKLWYDFLKKSEYRFLRQKPIGNYIADFYCPALKIVIEIDGDSHLSDEAAGYDSVRTAYLEGLGIHVIRINNKDVYNNFNEVCMTIISSIAPFTKGGCRQSDGGI